MLAPKPFEPYPGPDRGDVLTFSGWHMATSMMVAGRDIHPDRLGLFLLTADLPVILLITIVATPLNHLLAPMPASYVFAGVWLIGGSIWWFLFACLVARQFRKLSIRTGA